MRLVKDIAVIGAGVGGLITSTLLSRKGSNVVLIEKNHNCGGRMNSEQFTVNDDTYRFDVGPSLLLLPDIYEKTFSRLGENIKDHIELLKVEPLYRCYFEEDGQYYDISTNTTTMKQTLDSMELNGYDKFTRYMSTASDFLRFGLPTVIEENTNINFIHLFQFLLACLKSFPLLSHSTMLKQYFTTSKLQAMMSFQDLYIGLSPYEAPAVFSLLQALELEKGIYYPKGGFQSIAKSLESIARKNKVEIMNNCRIDQCNVDNNTKEISTINVHHINTNATTDDDVFKSISDSSSKDSINIIEAKQYITNIDVPTFEQHYLPSNYQDTHTIHSRPSCGIISLHFAFNTTLQSLTHHTLYLSQHYSSSWLTVEQPDTAEFNPSEFNFYVHAPSRTDTTVCPKGHDAITVLVPVPPLPFTDCDDKSTEALYDIASIRDAVLTKLLEMESKLNPSLKSLTPYLIHEHIRTPIQWKHEFSLFRGSAFGLAHSLNQLSLFRPRIRHPIIKNMYRVGASTRPGNGVPLVMIGSHLTTETVLKDINNKQNTISEYM